MMMVLFYMLVLVVTQAHKSSKTPAPAPSPSTRFLPQDMQPDCYEQCAVQICSWKQLFPVLYMACLNVCKQRCTQPPSQAHDAIYDIPT